MVVTGPLASTYRRGDRVRLEILETTAHVIDEKVPEIPAYAVPNQNALDDNVLTIRR